jgi:histidyl-tRNA synthetase
MKNEFLQRAKGVRDFDPGQAIKRQGLINILKETFERYGFNPIETPIIERYDFLASKFGQGDQSDAMRETFKLTDQGGRSLVLRNEFTMPLARYIAMNPNLKMPFKRFQIGQVFRDGPMKFGRYREFWQADIDIIGIKELAADAQLLMIAGEIFEELNLPIEIRINNRKLLKGIMNKFGIQQKDQPAVIISIDKLDKIGVEAVVRELQSKGLKKSQIKDLLRVLGIAGSNSEIIDKLVMEIGENEGLFEIKETLSFLPKSLNVKISPNLARGLAYYTGNIFEVFLTDKSKLTSAVAGGGRYDDMIGGLLLSKDQVPAIGISFGVETIMDALNFETKNDKQTVVQVYIVSLGIKVSEAFKTAEKFRKSGINVDLDLQGRKLKKNLEYCNSVGIPYVVMVGENEIKENKVTLRDLVTGKQDMLSLVDAIKIIKKASLR